jgi:hypothetical protein
MKQFASCHNILRKHAQVVVLVDSLVCRQDIAKDYKNAFVLSKQEVYKFSRSRDVFTLEQSTDLGYRGGILIKPESVSWRASPLNGNARYHCVPLDQDCTNLPAGFPPRTMGP